MKLRALFFAGVVLVAAGCFIATGDFSGGGCTIAEDCKGTYLCISPSSWPQTLCADGETGCVCELKYPPDGQPPDASVTIDSGPPPDAGTWCDDVRPLFLRSCVATCHSYMPSWPNSPKDFRLDAYIPPGTFPGVKDKIERVKARLIDQKDMPPVTELIAFPFSNAERAQVDFWYRHGFPEGDPSCDNVINIDAGSKTDGGTDGGIVSFVGVLVPIFQLRCAPCHTTNTSGGLSLTAANAYTNLVGPNATCNAAVKRVVANQQLNSMLWRKLTNAADKCGNAMPNMTAGLSTTFPADFAKIQTWINQGALNN